MAHKNIAIFIPHLGCAHRCSFCNQHTISGTSHAPTASEVAEICAQAMREIADKTDTEIAFFGGSFTAIPRDYLCSLLEAVQPFLQADGFCGIRISTRPDAISEEILALLRRFGVTAIELGAQSLCDSVLACNERGHDAAAVQDACVRIRAAGFELGLQLMIGLYGSTPMQERETLRRAIALHPDTVRMYPTVILQGTRLAQLYESGAYVPMPLADAVSLCADMLEAFAANDIRVIRCGLHASELVESQLIGGLYHPAFRELCDSLRYRRAIEAALRAQFSMKSGAYTVFVRPSCIGKAVGLNKENTNYFAARGIQIQVRADSGSLPFACKLERRQAKEHTCT